MSRKPAGKYPRYVSVYDVLLEEIQEGIYPPGTRLPGENDLAKRFGVSRNTLRQSLLLLEEDGYLAIRQGAGNIVLGDGGSTQKTIERLDNPLVSMTVEPIDRIETSFEFRKISPKHQKIFNLDSSKLLVLMKLVCICTKRPVGCSLVFIPYETLTAEGIEPSDGEKLNRFYDRFINSKGFSSISTVRVAYARAPVTSLLNIPMHQVLLMLDDVIMSTSGETVMTQKLFLMPDAYELHLTRRNRSKSYKE